MSTTAKMRDIQKAIEQTTSQPPMPLAVVEKPHSPRPMAPSRRGRVHIGAYLPPDFKRGIRMLQAKTDEDFQSMLARLLNEQFRLHGLPEVDQD